MKPPVLPTQFDELILVIFDPSPLKPTEAVNVNALTSSFSFIAFGSLSPLPVILPDVYTDEMPPPDPPEDVISYLPVPSL